MHFDNPGPNQTAVLEKGADRTCSACREVTPKGQASFKIHESVHRRFGRITAISRTDVAGSADNQKVRLSIKLGTPPAADEPFACPLSESQVTMVGADAVENANAMLERLLIYSRHQAGDAVWSSMRKGFGFTGSTVGGAAMTVLLGTGLPAMVKAMPRGQDRNSFAKAVGFVK